MEKISPTVKACFELLRATPGASSTELKKRFYEMAFIYHPDRNADPDAPEQFRRVTEAYELLLDQPRVSELNRNYLRERLHQPIHESIRGGLSLTFGSFFGYRLFYPDRAFFRKKARAFITGAIETSGDSSQGKEKEKILQMPVDEGHSILDHAAYDAIEVIYAGRLNQQDEEDLRASTDLSRLSELPWVALNNRGILQYLDRDFVGSERSYRELCQRVPGNIIFTYRLAVCLIIQSIENPTPKFFFGHRPDPKKINEALSLLRLSIRLGREREVGRQRCLAVQKTLADVLELVGQKSKSHKLWRQILEQDPRSAEATYRAKGQSAGQALLLKKKKPAEAEAWDLDQKLIGSRKTQVNSLKGK